MSALQNFLSKVNAAATAAVEAGQDQTVAKTGGNYTPPAAGPCRLRFIGYVEVGKQQDTFNGKPKVSEKVLLGFEVSGPKHPPIETADGRKVPQTIWEELTLSINEKAHFFKLFQRMNYAGTARHMAQLLGGAYKGTIVHRKYKTKAGKEGIAAELFDKAIGAYTIEPPRYEVVDPDTGPTGEFKELPVQPAVGPFRVFIWSHADKEQWDSLFIDGQYDAITDKETGKVIKPARSKNRFQLAIRGAVNFQGSLAEQFAAGLNLEDTDLDDDADAEVPSEGPGEAQEPSKPAVQGDAADPLNGVA